jgi:hypothetical protein
MPEIKGKTEDRKNATIDLDDGIITLTIKPGFLGGKGHVESINLDDVKSIDTGTGVKPFQSAQWALISHELGSVEFFTVNTEPLIELVSSVSQFLDEKERMLAESEAAFLSTREAHMALIGMNLDLIDSLMRLVILLEGSVRWDDVEAELSQIEGVVADRVILPGLNPSTFSMMALRNGVERRLSWVIKQEVHDTISLISQEASERSRNMVSWFPSDIHRLFVDMFMTLWNYQLAPITGIEPVDEAKDAQMILNNLHRAVMDYIDEESIEVPVIGKIEPTKIRAKLYLWTELLLVAEFSLEKK